MAQNPPAGSPRCSPYLFYDDIDAAVRFLRDAFGFEKRYKVPGPDGRTVHASMALSGGVVMMGSTKGPGGKRPIGRADGGPLHACVYFFVDDVDAHHAKAKAAGAEVLMGPEDQPWGDRIYAAVDPEGQFWTFATHVEDIEPGDMAGVQA